MHPLPITMAMLSDPAWLQDGALESALEAINLPRELLLDFACGCIVRALALADTLTLALHPHSLRFLETTRAWLHGQDTHQQWLHNATPAWNAMMTLEAQLTAQVHTSQRAQEHARALYQITRAIAWMGTPSAQEAADMAAWSTAEAHSYLGHEPHPNAWLQERSRQRQQLATLAIAQLQAQRATFLHQLSHRQARTQAAVHTWKDQLQDALYEAE